MKSIIKILTIDEEYVFLGDRRDLIDILQESKVVNFKLTDNTEIKLYPDISWGTMVFKGGLSLIDGINVRARTTDLEPGRLKVNFKTRIRPEHYFIIGLFAFFFLVTTFSSESKWIFIYLLGLWIVCHCWFHFIYRLQENHLMDKVIKKLRLVKM
jgi:hypothetical protein